MPMLEVKRINPEMFAAWSSQPEDLCFSLPVAPAWLLIILPFFAAKWHQFSSTAPNLIFKGKALNLTATIHLLTLRPSVYSSMGCVEKARPQLSSTWWPESNITSPRPKSQFPITESPADTEYTPGDQKKHMSREQLYGSSDSLHNLHSVPTGYSIPSAIVISRISRSRVCLPGMEAVYFLISITFLPNVWLFSCLQINSLRYMTKGKDGAVYTVGRSTIGHMQR